MFNFSFGGDEGMGGHGHGGRPRKEVNTTKFYEALGIAKGSDAKTIKKAYRKAAMKHHPDKGGDADTFKEISKAYEVLGDPEKKKTYDEYGEEGLESGGPSSHSDIFDLFTGGGGRGRGQRRKQKGEDVVFPLKVTLDDLYNGTSKKLRLTKNILCKVCEGKGGKGVQTCRDCKGQGVKIIIRQLGPSMIQQMQTACNTCRGTGQVIAEKDKCNACNGQKTVKEKKTLEVFVSKGMKHGQRVTFSNEADEAPDTIPGDVVVVLQQKEHSTYKRDGAHLFFKKKITLVEALCGFEFTITHLDKRVLVVRSEEGKVYKHGDFNAIRDEGMPTHKNPYVRGNLYVEFDVEFPSPQSLTPDIKKQLKKLLPAPSKMELDEDDYEEVGLEVVDIEAEKKRHQQQSKEAYEEDEERPRGGGQPGCRSQ